MHVMYACVHACMYVMDVCYACEHVYMHAGIVCNVMCVVCVYAMHVCRYVCNVVSWHGRSFNMYVCVYVVMFVLHAVHVSVVPSIVT